MGLPRPTIITIRRRGLAAHAIFLVVLLVLVVSFTYIRTLDLLQSYGQVPFQPLSMEGDHPPQDEGQEGNGMEGQSFAGLPTFLVVMPLIGLKNTSSSILERTVIQAWLGQSSEAGYVTRVLGLVEAPHFCDPLIHGLPGFTCTTLASHCLHPIYHILTIDCIFDKAIHSANQGHDDLIIFTNGDLFFSPAIFDAARHASYHHPQGFVIVGQRVDVNLTIAGGTRPEDVVAQAVDMAFSSGRKHQALGMDYFILPPKVVPRSFPPYLVGRWRWDNALLYHFFFSNVAVLDATAAVMAVHLGVHDYTTTSHLERKGADYNNKLALSTLGDAHNLGRIDNTPYILLPTSRNDNDEDHGSSPDQFIIVPRETPFHNLQIAALHSSSRGPHPSVMVVPVFPGQVLQALNWACWANAIGFTHYFFLSFDQLTHTALTKHGTRSVFLSVESKDLPPYHTTTRRAVSVPPSYRRLQMQVLGFLLRDNRTVSTVDVDLLWVQSPQSLLVSGRGCDATMIESSPGQVTGLPGTFLMAQPTLLGRAFVTGLAECLLYGPYSHDGGESPKRTAVEEECLGELKSLLPGLRLCRRAFDDYFHSYTLGSVESTHAFPLPLALDLHDGDSSTHIITQREQNGLWLWNKRARQCSSRYQVVRSEDAVPWALHILVLSEGRTTKIYQTFQSLLKADYSHDIVHLSVLVWPPLPGQRPGRGDLGTLERTLKKQWIHGDFLLVVGEEGAESLVSVIQAMYKVEEAPRSVVLVVEEGASVSPQFYTGFLAPGLRSYYYDNNKPLDIPWDPQMFGLVLSPPRSVQPPSNTREHLPVNASHYLYRCQRALAGGVAVVGPIWRLLLLWLQASIQQAQASASIPQFCIPGLQTSSKAPGPYQAFIPAFTRFTLEMGLYGVHMNHPSDLGLISQDPEQLAMGLQDVLPAFPPLVDLPLYDLYFYQVTSPASLWARAALLPPSCRITHLNLTSSPPMRSW